MILKTCDSVDIANAAHQIDCAAVESSSTVPLSDVTAVHFQSVLGSENGCS